MDHELFAVLGQLANDIEGELPEAARRLREMVEKHPARIEPQAFFFGVPFRSRNGHQLRCSNGKRHHNWPGGEYFRFFGCNIERELQPDHLEARRLYQEPEPQSVAAIHYVAGWTAMSMWDRSADNRGGCNANFFFLGELSFDEALEQARFYFLDEVERIERAAQIRPWPLNPPAPVKRHEPSWEELDPGIHHHVRQLWALGFNPTDSGDGVSKAPSSIVLEYPHVFCTVEPELLLAEVDRANTLMRGLFAGWCAEGSYSHGVAVIAFHPEPRPPWEEEGEGGSSSSDR